MTNVERELLVDLIEKELAKLNKKANDLKEFTAPISPDDSIGRISRMDAINNRSVFEASMRNVQARIDQLTQTIGMVNDANFGICTQCYQSIPMERLKLRPEIKICANCIKR